MNHHCHAEGCSAPVPPRMFACLRHWRMVPGWLQKALWRAYRPGQENDKRVTFVYLMVQTRCRLAIAQRENHPSVAELTQALGCTYRELLKADSPDAQLSDEEIIRGFDRELWGAP